jgi:hypothetical protein
VVKGKKTIAGNPGRDVRGFLLLPRGLGVSDSKFKDFKFNTRIYGYGKCGFSPPFRSGAVGIFESLNLESPHARERNGREKMQRYRRFSVGISRKIHYLCTRVRGFSHARFS